MGESQYGELRILCTTMRTCKSHACVFHAEPSEDWRATEGEGVRGVAVLY